MSPSDAAWQQLISALHASGRKAALAITGGGSGAVGELLRVPGGSRLLIEAQVPYDALALATFLGFAPAQACSSDTAIAMAQTARAPAARLVPSTGVGVGADLVGLGATAALVSDRPRKGEHRFHIAFANSAGIAHCTCVMAKGRRDRAAEEDLVSRAIVLWLARACAIAAPSPRSLLDADEHCAETVVAAGDMAGDTIDQLLAGELRMHVALEEIANFGSSFLVAVRLDAVGRVRALNDIPVPRRYADLFIEIPEHRFRFDTSSSEIRARGRAVGSS